jgi:hypothetical protein
MNITFLKKNVFLKVFLWPITKLPSRFPFSVPGNEPCFGSEINFPT